jgi:hypothetical protein
MYAGSIGISHDNYKQMNDIRPKNSLRVYLEDSGKAGFYPELMRRLNIEDVVIPDIFRKTLEYSRKTDELSLNRNPTESYRKRLDNYKGLSVYEIETIADSHHAASAEIVNEHNHPRLIQLFHDLCDELQLKKFGPENSHYPRLIISQSDIPQGSAASVGLNDRLGVIPSVIITSKMFDILSPGMLTFLLLHELHHINEASKISSQLRMFIRASCKESIIKEEYAADAIAAGFGINPKESAEALNRIRQAYMELQPFARDVQTLLNKCGLANSTGPMRDKLPAFLSVMLEIAEKKLNLIPKGAQKENERWIENPKEYHPSSYSRFEAFPESAPNPALKKDWIKRLIEESSKGNLLGK